jgi:hypothetical protein
MVHQSGAPTRLFQAGESLVAEPILPGFTVAVAALFE